MQKTLDKILNTNSKLCIIRLLISRRNDFIASGRQIAKMVKISPPAVHVALKSLYNYEILKREIVGRQHLYKLNRANRIVKNMLIPTFMNELSIKDDIVDFLKKQITVNKLKEDIISVILYGSFQTGETDETSDVDIAIVTSTESSKKRIEKVFSETIGVTFHKYFGAHLDIYIKTKKEFINRIKKNLPPVSTMVKAYLIIYGKDPIFLK